MITITPEAVNRIKEMQQAKNAVGAAIRIIVVPGCGGARFHLALDEKQEHDRVFAMEGLTFLLDRYALRFASELKIGFDAQRQEIAIKNLGQQ